MQVPPDFQARFDSERPDRVGPEWLQELRRQAMERFASLGMPDRRTPAWEHTDTSPLLKHRPAPAEQGPLDPAVLERAAFHGEAARLVFVDGRFHSRLSRTDELPEEVQATHLANVWESEAFASSQKALLPGREAVGLLNLAFLQDGAFVHVPEGMHLEHPIHIIHAHTRPGTATSTKHVVLAGRGAQVCIVESWVGSAPDTLSLHTTELVAAEGSRIRQVKQQLENSKALHLGRTEAQVDRDAQADLFLWSDGGVWSRSESDVRLIAPGAGCSVDGLWLGRNNQLHDCPSKITHAAPHTTSRELWKGIMDGQSRGVFLGNIVVEPGAQKTDSQQTNRNLLLSKKAHVDTTPQLEIHADDVQCAHGSTVGRLDPDALFFLRARGIGKEDAELLLTKAFAGEVLSRLGDWGIRTRLERRLENWFTRRSA